MRENPDVVDFVRAAAGTEADVFARRTLAGSRHPDTVAPAGGDGPRPHRPRG
ncbi:hypothetical protein ACFTXM_43730 [Streptomyces sp. NPDC056930]|uniref:hypothetical protein n=1 Tax=Streptomyces sp. NPDC056930 TaxID=3345967 RepID=UPI0036339B4B